MQRHIHRPDAQHGRVEVIPMKHPRVEVLALFLVAEKCGMVLSQIFAGGYQEAAGAGCRITNHVVRCWRD